MALIPILVAATFWAITILNTSFALQQHVLDAVRLNGDVLRRQLDEETGVRGFAATGRTVLLQPYNEAASTFDSTLSELAAQTNSLQIPAKQYIDTLRLNHDMWIAQVARPILRDPSLSLLELRGKTLIDRFRDGSSQLGRAIERRSQEADARTRIAITQLGAMIMVITVVVSLLIVYASQRQRRLLDQINSEQDVIRILQSALVNNLNPVLSTEVGTAYISATDGAAVGGDFFDAQPLDDKTGYFIVGDVSGKGVNAAVDTALIRHAVRTLFTVTQDPGEVLTRFNTTFIAARSSPDVFVVMFVCVVDVGSLMMKYASAGHSQAYLRRNSSVTQFKVTGSLLGVIPDTEISTEYYDLVAGDLLVITTDGLTEARDAELRMLEDDGAMAWIREGNDSTPQTLVDAIIKRLKIYAPMMRDDLAILAVRIGVPARANVPLGNGGRRSNRPGSMYLKRRFVTWNLSKRGSTESHQVANRLSR